MYSVEEICEEQERQYNQLMQEDDQYCHPESFKWGFEHGFEYALSKFGWHPASESPVFDEFDDNKEVIGIWMQENSSAYFVTIPYNVVDYVQYENGKWLYDGSSVPVKYWCYPPEKDE